MGIIVDHEKRKAAILKKALGVFVDEGYEDATFQKIANRCGITRTTLYIYFKNKREIFLWSIKQLTENIEESLKKVVSDTTLSYTERLSKMLESILFECIGNRELFSVILSYLIQLRKSGKDPHSKVRRRTIRLKHLLSTIIIAGIKNGEFKNINVKEANDMFYSFIEAAIFRMAVLDQKSIDEVSSSIQLAVSGIVLEKK